MDGNKTSPFTVMPMDPLVSFVLLILPVLGSIRTETLVPGGWREEDASPRGYGKGYTELEAITTMCPLVILNAKKPAVRKGSWYNGGNN